MLREGDKWQDGDRTPSSDIGYLTIAPGIGWSNDKIQTLVAYQRIVVGKNTDANDSMALAIGSQTMVSRPIVLTCVYTF